MDQPVARVRGVEPTKSIKVLTADNSPYAVQAGDDYFLADCTKGPITVTIPRIQTLRKANPPLQRTLLVKKIDATINAVTVAAQTPDLIDGAATLVMTTQYQSRTIVNDLRPTVPGWWVI